MRTVDFDTAAANLNGADLGGMTREQLKLTYAIFCAMESKLYYIARENDTFDENWYARNQQVVTCKDTVLRVYKEVYPDEVADAELSCAVHPDEGTVTFRELAKSVRANFDLKFMNIIDEDEHYVFRMKLPNSKAPEVKAFLLAEWEGDLGGEKIDIEEVEWDCQSIPDIYSWTEAEKLLKKSKVKVTITPPAVVPKSEEEVANLINEARTALAKTGLTPYEAIGLVATELDVAIRDDRFY